MLTKLTNRKKKAAGAVLAAVLLVGGATACEDGKKDTGASAAPSKAAETGAAKGAVQVTPAAYLEKVKKKSEEITSLRYAMSGSAGGEQVSGEVSMRLKPSLGMSMHMATPGGAGESVDIRLIDGAMYMGTEGQWLKFDMKSLDPNMAKQLESAGKGPRSGENPGDKAGDLLGAKDLKTVGEETIDGQKTTHVSGTVTLEQMKASLATASPEVKERQEKSVKQLEDLGVDSMTMDMWIDENDHAKQVRTRSDSGKGAIDITIKVLDYNKPVEIAVPPADQVVDFAAIMEDGSQS
ncbi:LppX_LprAFG lipoprotein [Streptomyces sp. NPDC051183]|uniref:LppX_LprAFG lipoprotein n=1 Tax=unclassified Streptomyces TaxID=2593676 RepID=UPI00341CCD8F